MASALKLNETAAKVRSVNNLICGTEPNCGTSIVGGRRIMEWNFTTPSSDHSSTTTSTLLVAPWSGASCSRCLRNSSSCSSLCSSDSKQQRCSAASHVSV